jgi:hypothetical protein
MRIQLKRTFVWTTVALCMSLLAVLQVACGAAGSNATSPPSSPSPTSPPSTATSTTQIVGNGYTMSYPQNWQVTRSGTRLVTLADSANAAQFTITVIPDPNATVSADALTQTGIKAASVALKNSQTVPTESTATIGGESWKQGSVAGAQRLNNRDTVIQVVVAANVYPAQAATSKGYTIVYRAPQSTFDSMNTTYFQPMLQSFKFV